MTNTQIVPDGEAIRIKMSEALAEIKAHVYTLESTLKTSIKANGQFVAEIIALKAERDAALARVSELETALTEIFQRVDWESPGAAFEADSGCLQCTGGTTPNNRNTGPCAYHKAMAALTKDQSNDT